MTQETTIVAGTPEDLKKALDAIITDGKVIFNVIQTSFASKYVIIYGTEA